MNLDVIAEALHRADSELSAYAAHRPLEKREAQEVSDLCRRALKELPSLRAGKAQEWSTSKDAGSRPAAPSSEGSASCANPLDADEILNRIRATTWVGDADRETFAMSRPAALELLSRLAPAPRLSPEEAAEWLDAPNEPGLWLWDDGHDIEPVRVDEPGSGFCRELHADDDRHTSCGFGKWLKIERHIRLSRAEPVTMGGVDSSGKVHPEHEDPAFWPIPVRKLPEPAPAPGTSEEKIRAVRDCVRAYFNKPLNDTCAPDMDPLLPEIRSALEE